MPFRKPGVTRNMELKNILTPEELATLPSSVGPKLEAAFVSEMNAAIDAERKKSGKKLSALVESISDKAEAKITAAVTECVNMMRNNAINDKMYQLVRGMANLLESSGIPVSEDSKRLKAELDQCNFNLQKAYAEREHVKKEYNDQKKKNFIYQSVKGMRPEIVDAVMNEFVNYDIREITAEAINDFIHRKSSPSLLDVDADTGSTLDLDKVHSAIDDIDHAFELDNPSFPSRESRNNAYAAGTRSAPMRYNLSIPNVSYGMNESVGTPPGISPDVAEAIAQMGNLSGMGFV